MKIIMKRTFFVMGNKLVLCMCFTLCMFVFIGCNKVNTEILKDNWRYAVGEIPDNVEKASRYEYQKLDSILNLHNKIENEKGILWLKNVFTLPENFKDKELAFLLGRINLADETYLNGVLIGNMGRMGKDFFSEWNSYRYYPATKNLFSKNGENTLLIKVFVRNEGNISNIVALDEKEEIEKRYAFQHFFFTKLNMIISFLLLFVAVYYLFIYLKRIKDLENLFYSLVLFMYSIYNINFFFTYLFPNLSLAYIIHQKVVYVTMMLSLLFLKMFILEFIKRKENKIVKSIIYGLTLITLIAIISAPNYDFLFIITKGPVQFVFIVTMTYIGFNLVRTFIKDTKNKEFQILLIGYIPLAVVTMMDIFAAVLRLENYIYVSSYGVAFFLIVLAVILANRFVNYRNEAEDLNEHLEQKVEERTKQLETANREMKRINLSLIKTNNDLENARAIAEKDMKMAVNVQSAFFPKNIPETDTWDISFIFKPMAGVSGDFYDFYSLKENHISGVGLFDVSGHGIASGLITMIAKSIIARHFVKMTNKNLNELMKMANKNLIYELNNVDNYLTGILLRFSESKGSIVEYINAGHTDLLYRTAKTKNVHIVKFKDDKPFRGMFLGLRGMESEYIPIKFRVKHNDVLLLYSDCLNESINEQMEEYGVDRISKSLENAPDTSADDILDYILNDFYGFIGNKALNDDLTIIVLKRK